MRLLLPLPLLGIALLLVEPLNQADARPQFARRESKACGFCHINPMGGGPRNQNGLRYARNEFKFPPRKGSLNDFTNQRNREAMIRVRKILGIDHTKVAIRDLKRLHKATKSPAAKKAVADEIHALDVKGSEILGEARRLCRKSKGRPEGIALLVLLTSEYREFEASTEAKADLKELTAEKENRPIVAREKKEAKARLLYLDAQLARVDGKLDKAEKLMRKLMKTYPESRVVDFVKNPPPDSEG